MSLERKLDQARRRNKRKPGEIEALEEELTMPTLPVELNYLWRVYHRLRKRTGDGFSSANPISWHDMEAFMRVTRFRLKPWEVELIEAIDDAFRQPQLAALKNKMKSKDNLNLIDSSDTKSIRSLMRTIGKRRSGREGVPSQT